MSVQDDVLRIAVAAEQLLREAKRLNADLASLTKLFAGMETVPDPVIEWGSFPNAELKMANRRTVVDSINIIEAARGILLNSEYQLRTIEGIVNGIEKDAYSREELKEHMRDGR